MYFKKNTSVIEIAKAMGISIPRFCYHELLSVAGNCRMCMIEVDSLEKPAIACSTELRHGMQILTNSPFVKKARENVLESLLINHPLDCPICDQAGECDLQEQVKYHGSTQSRYFYIKKTKEDKYCNPLIKTIMTRCITCTRCARFSSEVAGSEFFGTTNRGKSTEITSYISNLFDSEVSGNVVDLCPVGALNSGPTSYKGRPWELHVVESIDISNSLNLAIYIDLKENKPYRVLPKNNLLTKSTLLSDSSRYSHEHIFTNRIIDFEILPTFSTLSVYFHLFIKYYEECSRMCDELHCHIRIYIDTKIDLKSSYFLKSLSYCFNSKFNKISLRILNNPQVNSNSKVSSIIRIKSSLGDVNSKCYILASNIKQENSLINTYLRTKFDFSSARIINYGFNYNSNLKEKFGNFNLEKLFYLIEFSKCGLANSLLKEDKSFFLLSENILNRVSNINPFLQEITYVSPLSKALILCYNNYEGVKSFNLKNFSNNIMNIKSKHTLDVFFNLEDDILTRRLFKDFNSSFKIWQSTNYANFIIRKNFSPLNKKSIPFSKAKKQLKNSNLVSSYKVDILIPLKSFMEEKKILINFEHKPQWTQKSLEYNLEIDLNIFKIFGPCFNKEKLFVNSVKDSNVEDMFPSYCSYITELCKTPLKFDTTNTKPVNLHLNFDYSDCISIISRYKLKQSIKDVYTANLYGKNSSSLKECSDFYQSQYSNLA